jgi:hypothetical protein
VKRIFSNSYYNLSILQELLNQHFLVGVLGARRRRTPSLRLPFMVLLVPARRLPPLVVHFLRLLLLPLLCGASRSPLVAHRGLAELERSAPRTLRRGIVRGQGACGFQGPPSRSAILVVRTRLPRGALCHICIAGGIADKADAPPRRDCRRCSTSLRAKTHAFCKGGHFYNRESKYLGVLPFLFEFLPKSGSQVVAYSRAGC